MASRTVFLTRSRRHGGLGCERNPNHESGADPRTRQTSRLDALARLERLAGAISSISFYLLDQIVGRERWMKDVAGELRTSPEYVAQRFREAIWEATVAYC